MLPCSTVDGVQSRMIQKTMKIEGTVAFVTGGARGIGRAICKTLLNAKAKVCFVDLDGESGNKTASELKEQFPGSDVLFVQCDVTNHHDFVEAYKIAESKLGKIAIHVNNAGIVAESKWSLTIDVNLKGVVEGTYIALEHMRVDKGGQGGVIINISSIAGLDPNQFLPVYSATKAAVIAFTSAWAEEDHFMEHGVRLNVICPMVVDTDLAATCPSDVYHYDVLAARLESAPRIPASKIGDVVLQIVENDNDNGEVLIVSPDGVHYKKKGR